MKKLFLLLFIFFNGLYADSCVNFNNITNNNVIKEIAKELRNHGKVAYKNNEKCDLQIFLPIKVFINSTNQSSQVDIYIIYSKNNSERVYHKFSMAKTDVHMYDFTQKESRKELQNNIIKKHSKYIAEIIQQL